MLFLKEIFLAKQYCESLINQIMRAIINNADCPDLHHDVGLSVSAPESDHSVKAPGHHEAVSHCVHVAGVTQSGHTGPSSCVCDWSVITMKPSHWSVKTIKLSYWSVVTLDDSHWSLTCLPDQSQHEALWVKTET